jgi:hypothetical protein
MSLRWIRAIALAALAPAAALAFETIETIPYPSRGGFPDAYDRDPAYPVNLWAQAGLMFDSNPFRLNDDANTRAVLGKDERWDTVMRVGVGADYFQTIYSRQAIRLTARGDYYDYLRYDTFDNFSYGIGAEWLWELTSDLTGTVGYGRTQGLGDPAEVQAPVKDEVTTNRSYAEAAYRLGPSVRLRGGAENEHGQREGDRPTVSSDVTTFRGGIDYVTGLRNSIGVEARRSEGSDPLGEDVDPTLQFANNRYQEREYAVVATYNLGTQITFGGRLGRTWRRYSEAPIEDFDGTTGSASIGWRPEPKLNFVFEAYREPRPIIEVDATFVDVRGVRFGPSWGPTLKLVFGANFIHERRLFNQLVGGAFAPRDETVRIWSFFAGWEPQRHFRIGAGVDWGERESNTLGRDYDYVAVMANLRYDW